MSRYRKAQTEAEESEERANVAEQAVAKLRARTLTHGGTLVKMNLAAKFEKGKGKSGSGGENPVL